MEPPKERPPPILGVRTAPLHVGSVEGGPKLLAVWHRATLSLAIGQQPGAV
jgi:hypothetical protein